MVDDGKVEEVSLNSNRIYITLTDKARPRRKQGENRSRRNPADENSFRISSQAVQTGAEPSRKRRESEIPDYYTGYM